ncbi:hypothetical protein K450DRAFT_258851 [Umbelopsis ramanniana AG]|uniref:RGS domain-containing protein n=1 Tax=Umbelopsis ramanniana AG TaxID=1314678 RepID=A0AAD5E222_UMBRA|nr:uncharacterized protein K450DRAFT_258851 [Umbelopsis ramanniana AG]KAI8575991.1 hypothetical protein K450DRAFT_258851 [Umbelopsis ramanniana AG]
MTTQMEDVCKLASLVDPLPDCSNTLVLEQFDLSDDTTPEVICQYFRLRLIVNRVYFTLALINMVYVICTTALLIHRARAVQSNEKKLRFPVNEKQIHTLRKRNLLALAVGETGHLLVISISLIIKALDGCIYCPIFMYVTTYGYYMWIASFIWRAYYLRFQLSLHKIKLRLGNGESEKDRKWYIHNRDKHSISNGRFMLLLLCGMVLVTVPLILMHRYYYGFDHVVVKTCSTRIGTMVLLFMVTFFQCIISPVLIWLLRHDRDAHNLRNELIAIFAVGIPTSVLYLVWVTIFPPSISYNGPNVRLFWGSINWIGLSQAVAHFIAVTYPLLASYGLCTCPCIKKVERYSRTGRRKSSISVARTLDCTTVSLEYILTQPELLEHLKHVAVQDFSTENVLFCEQYSILANKTMAKLNETRPLDEKPHKMNYTSLTSDPIPHELQTDYIAFYNTFIKAGAPLQVNITYSDRKAMDAVFKEYAKQQQHVLENVVSQVQMMEDDTWGGEELVLFASAADSKRSVTSITEDPLLGQPSTTSTIRCSVFDSARKEVMWIIFCNILPKFIEDCK